MANGVNGSRKAGTTTDTCPLKECKLVVEVNRKDGKKLSKQVPIDVKGPKPATSNTVPVHQYQVFEKMTPCEAEKDVYRVSIKPAGDEAKFSITADPADAQMHVPGGATGTFIFELSAAAWIEFKVLYDKPPAGTAAEIAGVEVQLQKKDNEEHPPKATTGPGAKAARLTGIEPGTRDIESVRYAGCVLEVVDFSSS